MGQTRKSRRPGWGLNFDNLSPSPRQDGAALIVHLWPCAAICHAAQHQGNGDAHLRRACCMKTGKRLGGLELELAAAAAGRRAVDDHARPQGSAAAASPERRPT